MQPPCAAPLPRIKLSLRRDPFVPPDRSSNGSSRMPPQASAPESVPESARERGPRHVAADAAVVVKAHLAGRAELLTQTLARAQQPRLGCRQAEPLLLGKLALGAARRRARSPRRPVAVRPAHAPCSRRVRRPGRRPQGSVPGCPAPPRPAAREPCRPGRGRSPRCGRTWNNQALGLSRLQKPWPWRMALTNTSCSRSSAA